MNFKRFTVLLTVLFAIAVCVPCNAAVSASATYDSQNDTINISGEGNGIISITMQIDSSGTSHSDDNPPLYYRAISATDNYYMHTFKLPSTVSGGTYYICATDSNGMKKYDSIIIPSMTDDPTLLAELNSASNASALSALLKENSTALGIDTNESLFINNTDEISKVLLSYNENYATIKSFYTSYYKAFAIASLKEADKEKISSIFEKYQKNLGIKYLDDFKDYNFKCDGSIDTLCSELASSDLAKLISADNDKSFKNVYNELIFISEVKSAQNWQDLRDVLTVHYPDYVKCDNYKKYTRLGNPDRTFQLMYGETLSDVDTVVKFFKNSVDKAYREENPSSSNNGGGGSSGGGGGGGLSVKLPPVSTTPDASVPASKPTFTDVTANHWAYDAISTLAGENIINGYPNGNFDPVGNVTRAEFAKMLCTAFRLVSSDTSHSFKDVDTSAWYSDYINAAYNAGIIKGINETKFMPNATIKREDACVMINRAIKNYGIELAASAVDFSDKKDISLYAQSDISALFTNGIVNGVSDTTFSPQSAIKRAESAQLIYKALKFIKVI